MNTIAHPDSLPTPERVDALKKRTGEAIRKGALATALDSALNVVVEVRREIQDPDLPFTSGERQGLAVTLEQMGRLCFSVARECDRKGVGK